MPTLKQRILDEITTEYPANITNQQLATRLDANEPSVRRAVRELTRAGFVHYDRLVDYNTGTIGWKRNPMQMPVPASATQDTASL